MHAARGEAQASETERTNAPLIYVLGGWLLGSCLLFFLLAASMYVNKLSCTCFFFFGGNRSGAREPCEKNKKPYQYAARKKEKKMVCFFWVTRTHVNWRKTGTWICTHTLLIGWSGWVGGNLYLLSTPFSSSRFFLLGGTWSRGGGWVSEFLLSRSVAWAWLFLSVIHAYHCINSGLYTHTHTSFFLFLLLLLLRVCSFS